MKIRGRYIASGALWAVSLTVAAQQTMTPDTTMNRTVVVEQNYMPEVAEATKINVLPQVEQPSVEKPAVSYAYTPAPATAIPAGKMEVMDRETAAPHVYSGFLRAGYGIGGNLDVAGSYLGHLSERDRLDASVTVRGMDRDILFYEPEQLYWQAHYYQTQAKLGYVHRFDRMELGVAGHFDMHSFNYTPDVSTDANQRFRSGDLHIGLGSTDEDFALQFNAETNVMVYDRKLASLREDIGGVTEYRVKTLGSVSGTISEHHAVTVALEMNNLIYNQPFSSRLDPFQDRTLLDLNPYYEYDADHFKVRLGANVDLSPCVGQAIRVSPDVEGRFTFSDRYVLFLKATGGRMLGDFRRLEQLSPYIIDNRGLVDSYELVNAQLGLKGSPLDGLWFQLACGYQYVADELFSDYPIYAGGEAARILTGYRSYSVVHGDASSAFVQARMSYSFKQFVDFAAGFEYRNWSVDAQDKFGLLSQKPKYLVDMQLGLTPLQSLRIELGYNYQKRAESFTTFYGQQQEDMNLLYAGANYAVLQWLSVYARCNNILNDSYCKYPFVPEQGIHFVAGLRCKF